MIFKSSHEIMCFIISNIYQHNDIYSKIIGAGKFFS